MPAIRALADECFEVFKTLINLLLIMKKDKPEVKIMVLDILKPHKPNIIDFGKEIKSLTGVKNVELVVTDVDDQTEKVQVIIEGKNLKFERIKNKIEHSGATVHSLDEAVIN